ncbi:MAG: nucleotide exchange factor GrpE [Candidatus Liptonbacteria bacterium RIFCSPLOWO2_01_FULL_52_25]|uniref:Protein GrpE n=1 Tax=Candidatus Liptonbacteria bacterium RIFCSPLOWO2_01_FULL_52_25 TaxID=1798650 RepID=A0A1G2CDY8_9BACT|nr:MAG: nucleotide exchange factor GrpE [Candidatus Liptonbacteria bacterium RIFCSPLOWO2_01_FULL_52_25]
MDENNKTQNSENDLAEKLAAAEKQRDEYLAGWQRAKADFINYRKEEMQHLEDVARYGGEEIIKDFIGVLDSFDLGLRAMEKAGPVEKGVYMIRAQIEDILRRRGVERITMKVGDEFDPSVAEAIAIIESDKPSGTVLEEIEPGYKLHDKIIRPARVKVAKG